MLDENLPTFRFRPSSDNPQVSVGYYTRNGSEPAPEYVFKRADPATTPAARGKYAAALADPYSSDVVYAEVVVEPEWQQPTLSAAELRAQGANGAAAAPTAPGVPDSFNLLLYNPDQTIPVRMIPGSWNRAETWEFEMPSQSFRLPSASQLDREQGERADGVVRDLAPKIMFKWKKDGRLSKDMTCYMAGKSLGRHKSKEPDITVALFKQSRDSSALTVYEPNLQRVEVEDRKGLDIVLLLGAEVIKDLYLAPRQDLFNLAGAAAGGGSAAARTSPPPPTIAASALSTATTAVATSAGARRRHNSRPMPTASPPPTMSGAISSSSALALSDAPPPLGPPPPTTSSHAHSTAEASAAEARRLQAAVERAEREERERRERRDREEQKRIKRMLEAEDKERRRREAEVAKETERLRRKYGVEGQELPSRRPGRAGSGSSPPLPPRHQQEQGGGGGGGGGGWYFTPPPPPPPPPARPLSAGPSPTSGPFACPTANSWWRGPSGGSLAQPGPVVVPPPPPPPSQRPPQNGPPKRRSGSGPYLQNPSASASAFFFPSRDGGRERSREEERRRVQKKRSVHF